MKSNFHYAATDKLEASSARRGQTIRWSPLMIYVAKSAVVDPQSLLINTLAIKIGSGNEIQINMRNFNFIDFSSSFCFASVFVFCEPIQPDFGAVIDG